MARAKTVYRCTDCGVEAPKWMGWCTACDASGTLVEERAQPPGPGLAPGWGGVGGLVDINVPSVPIPIAEAVGDATEPVPTGDVELDRVLGGGFVPGSVTVLGGEPGVGKSTLLLQALADQATRGCTCLYVTAEESARQVALRAERLGLGPPSLWLVAETSLPQVLHHIETLGPDVVVVDSIQTVFDPEMSSAPGSVGQVRGCAHRLVATAKGRGVTVVLVGHVTKDGRAGRSPGARAPGRHGARVRRRAPPRAADAAGAEAPVREHPRAGPVRDGRARASSACPTRARCSSPTGRPAFPGSVVAPVLDGQRPLLVEVQALVAPSPAPAPRRTAQGIDGGRLAQVLAVLERHAELPLGRCEVHVAVAGGRPGARARCRPRSGPGGGVVGGGPPARGRPRRVR